MFNFFQVYLTRPVFTAVPLKVVLSRMSLTLFPYVQVVGERTELYKQVKDLKENLTLANSTKREVTDSTKKLKQQLNESTVSSS